MRSRLWRAASALALVAIAAVSGLTSCSERMSSDTAADTGGPIFIISVDTLRADHLPVYGATDLETPHLTALAADSIVFDHAYSQVPLTLPSHASMLTGRLPASIGIRNNLGYRFDPSIPSLPALLSDEGFETGAAVSAYVLRQETGLGSIFDHYDDSMESAGGAIVGEIQRAGDETVSAALEWLRSRDTTKVFFFLHLFDPHAPYDPPEPWASQYADRPYDGEIAASDAAIGRFLDGLRELGMYEDATIVFMSDHGEGLGDHGESQHGIFLYREAIHVPLFIKLPGGARSGERVARPVALLDVFPTIAEQRGLAISEEVAGLSLLADAPADRRIYSETMYPRIHLGWSDLASLVDQTHHYIEAPRPELYDLQSDPGEHRNVLADQRRVYASMREEIAAYDRALESPRAISPEDAAKLSALGYLGGGGAAIEGDLPDPKDRIADLESFSAAATAVREGRGAGEIARLEQIVARNETFADAWTLLAKAYHQADRPDDAVRAYRRTIEVAPMLAPGTALSLAEVYLELGRLDDAVEHAELAAQAHPASASRAKARALLGMGRTADAERALGPALSDPATRDEARVVQAEIYTAQRRFGEALGILEVAGVEAPVAGRAFAKADALARMGRMEEAKAAFRQEIRDFPRNREAYIRLAAIQLLGGEAAGAEAVIADLLEANPGPATRAMAARALRDLGRGDLAEKIER